MSALLLPAAEIRAVEARARGKGEPLMLRAGRATAQFAARIAGDTGEPVLVVAGPGNNGGDAWVAARFLQQAFHRVTVLDAGAAKPLADPVAREAKAAFTGNVASEWPDAHFSLIIDGLFGIGLSRTSRRISRPSSSASTHRTRRCCRSTCPAASTATPAASAAAR